MPAFFRLMERMGLRGTLAFGAVLLTVNGFAFYTVSQNVARREQEKSDAIRKSMGTVKSRPVTFNWGSVHREELRRLRRERGINDFDRYGDGEVVDTEPEA